GRPRTQGTDMQKSGAAGRGGGGPPRAGRGYRKNGPAGRRGGGPPPSEASSLKNRAAGSRGAGAPPSDGEHHPAPLETAAMARGSRTRKVKSITPTIPATSATPNTVGRPYRSAIRPARSGTLKKIGASAGLPRPTEVAR